MPGYLQIIPTSGPHTQIYVNAETINRLWGLRLIEYDPDYGPNANVWRPVGLVDDEGIRKWFERG